MDKKNYLSMGEQEVWRFIGGRDIIDSELLSEVFPDMPKGRLNKAAASLAKKGYLRRARKGLYYNPEKLGDIYGLAFRMHDGYIAFSSALKYHGLLDYEDFRIFIATKGYRQKIELMQYDVWFIPLGRQFTGFEKKGGHYVSNIEKTLFDCMSRPGRFCGYPEISKAFLGARIDWERFVGYFKTSGNDALCQRTGYLLEVLKRRAGLKVPGPVLEYLEGRVKKPARMLPGRAKSRYDAKWKIQDSLGEGALLP